MTSGLRKARRTGVRTESRTEGTDRMTQPFSRVLRNELRSIDDRRRATLASPAYAPPITEGRPAENQALERDLAGLALSGGGIRSAAFNLGVLQGLAEYGLLPHFDYLSTVSGGGYIGSWLHGVILRMCGGKPGLANDWLAAGRNPAP